MTTNDLPKGIKTKPTARSLAMFSYFSQYDDEGRLPEIKLAPEGWTAAECFHVWETFGIFLPCKEPKIFSKALNGKEVHGLTVTHCAEDYIDRLLFASDLKSDYPEWVRKDILGRASQLAYEKLGYIPRFVITGEDFSTMSFYGKIKLD